jgi:hypothetical protein
VSVGTLIIAGRKADNTESLEKNDHCWQENNTESLEKAVPAVYFLLTGLETNS